MNWTEICERYRNLYTGAIADVLDHKGYRNQSLPHWLQAQTLTNRVAGPAFTGRGQLTSDPTSSDMETRLRMLDSITPGTVSVWSCGEGRACAHWAS